MSRVRLLLLSNVDNSIRVGLVEDCSIWTVEGRPVDLGRVWVVSAGLGAKVVALEVILVVKRVETVLVVVVLGT